MQREDAYMENKTEITLFENITQTMADIREKEADAYDMRINDSKALSRRDRKTRSTQRYSKASEEQNLKFEK